jgi:hypothetical protein
MLGVHRSTEHRTFLIGEWKPGVSPRMNIWAPIVCTQHDIAIEQQTAKRRICGREVAANVHRLASSRLTSRSGACSTLSVPHPADSLMTLDNTSNSRYCTDIRSGEASLSRKRKSATCDIERSQPAIHRRASPMIWSATSVQPIKHDT